MAKKHQKECWYCGKQRQTMYGTYMCVRCRASATYEALKAHRLRKHAVNCTMLFKAGMNTADIAKKIMKSEAFVYNAMWQLHKQSVDGAFVHLPRRFGEDGGLATKEVTSNV